MSLNSTQPSTIRVKKLKPNIGATIENVDLSQALSADDVKVIRQAWLDYKVIFFQDQNITPEQYLDFARYFGDIELKNPYSECRPNYPGLLPVITHEHHDNQVSIWHYDVSYPQRPCAGTILRSLILPEMGGDTAFSNMEKLYEDLPEETQERLEGLQIRSGFPFLHKKAEDDENITQKMVDDFDAEFPPAEYPLIRTHPETGRKCVFANCVNTEYIVGLEEDESQEILGELYRRTALPEYQCRIEWRTGSIAFWDNRSCQHYGIRDYAEHRELERITLVGDEPF